MRSMTGFGIGRGEFLLQGSSESKGRIAVEIRALNHRYQDVRVRLPSELGDHSFFLEQLARTKLGRGRYDVAVRVEGRTLAAPRLATDRLKALLTELTDLRDEVAPDSTIDIGSLLVLPDVLEQGTDDVDDLREALSAAFDQAHARLTEMREREGATLREELKSRLASAREVRQQIAAGSQDLVVHHRERLRDRVEKLLAEVGTRVDQERLEIELAIVADKSDVTEELVRLGSHFDQLDELMNSKESVGRRIDFLLQEVGREVNTIGSKCQHVEVSHLVVEMKAELERMREQVQNVD